MRETVAKMLFMTVLMKYVLCRPFDFKTLFVMVDTLAVQRFNDLIGRVRNIDIGGGVVVLNKTCLFLTVVKFYVSTSSSGVFLPCLLLLLCVVVDRLCLGGRDPVLG